MDDVCPPPVAIGSKPGSAYPCHRPASTSPRPRLFKPPRLRMPPSGSLAQRETPASRILHRSRPVETNTAADERECAAASYTQLVPTATLLGARFKESASFTYARRAERPKWPTVDGLTLNTLTKS
ncbi:hypothetical protein K505DRAFT_57012 [Melanomma pulvis-pyrius CBS 109.77]|uniref:Uncharacterized protein n=1 Tax=Melanomma pulvis-pyrius CBS 109.77 TaxID=1314802 RepID=A0A6A6X849_9PLEO|nr:hypothetical protein K505DRAFT_57012 [Melanomma pulvis-pyrius CBS 109.77]